VSLVVGFINQEAKRPGVNRRKSETSSYHR